MKARLNQVSGLKGMALVMTLVMSVSTGQTVLAGGVLFVDDDAPAAGDGLSWNTAYRFLRDALDTASLGGISEIRVAQGTYLPDHSEASPTGTGIPDDFFELTNGLTLNGGYAGLGNPDPNARNITLFETILSGDLLADDGPLFTNRNDNTYQVVSVPSVALPVVIEGLTIRSGYAIFGPRRGGGLIGFMTDLTIRQCRFIDNRAWHRGGGIYYDSGSLTIEQCEFRENFADIQNSAEGGAIFLQNSSAHITDSLFVGNFVKSSGGAIYSNFTGQVTIDRCQFFSNRADRSAGGAVLHNSDDSFLLTNTILIGNFASVTSGALHISGSGIGVVRNSTIAFNTAGNRYGGILFSSGDASLKSCVLWGNVASQSVGEAKQVLMEGLVNAVDYCCIEGLTGGFGGLGNIGDNPLFVDADGVDNVIGTEDDDLHLSADSLSIDTGDPGFVPLPGETDLDGQPRIIAGRVDMGMDEAFSLGLDCNLNGIADATDIIDGTSLDCNTNNIPDECDLADVTSLDCNLNGIPDECDIAGGTSLDCNVNGVPDDCDISSGFSLDNNANGVPDECDPPDPILARAGKKLYVTAVGKVSRYNLDGTGRVDLISDILDAPFDVEVDVPSGKVYWTDSFDHKIHRSNLDGTAKEIVIENIGEPHGIALDVFIGKIYWTDATNALIRRANIDGTAVETVLSTGLGEPRGIAVNSATGTVYWVDAGALKIMRMDQAGTNVATLVSSGLTDPNDIEVDDIGGKFYWTDNPAFETGVLASIRRANLNGSGTEILALEGGILLGPRFLALDRVVGKVYWTGVTSSSKIKRMNMDGSVLQDLGIAGEGIEGIAVDPIGGKLYYASPLSGPGAQGHLRQANLDNTNRIDLDFESIPDRTDITVSMPSGLMYWTHDPDDIFVLESIRAADLVTGSSDVEIVNGAGDSVGDANGITTDALPGGFIYWAERNGRVFRASQTGVSPITLISDPLLSDTRFVELDLAGGKIYISERSTNMFRANLNGTGLELIITNPCADARGIGVDSAAGKLYWAGDCSDSIKRSNLNGTSIETLLSTFQPQDLELDLDGGKMYWVNDAGVHRANLDGSDMEQIIFIIQNGERFSGLDILPADCNCNNIPDSQDILTAFSLDLDANGIPDECDAACNTFGITDTCAISRGESQDCNNNGIPDQCDISANTSEDCNLSLIPDECELGTELDSDFNGILDRCEIQPQSCSGDITSDGAVNVTDLLELLANWGPCPIPCSPGLVNDPDSCPADVDRGCAVNVTSLLTLLAAWGPCP